MTRRLVLLWLGRGETVNRFLALTAVLFVAALVSIVRVEAAGQAAQPPAPASSETYRDVYNGWKWWHVYCYRCHGVDALGSTLAPNLADPTNQLTPAEFLKIVRNGIPDKGMQAWNKLLDDKQIGQLHLYVRARADKVLPPGRPDEVGPNRSAWVPPDRWPGL
jgi:mono/diheme cytochrome c family protein